MSHYKPYLRYKDSGVEWLGRVPEHWSTLQLRRIAHFAYGDGLMTEDREEGPVPVYGSNGSVGSHNVANTRAPTIIIGRKGSFGKLNYCEYPVFAIDTTYFVDQRHTLESLKWFFYALQPLNLDAHTKDSAVPGLSREDAYGNYVPLPPRNEQEQIALFLDRETAHIDALIEKKQRLVELLKEKRQAVITQAVTKGLDPNVPMKGSGVEWLGEVPANWRTLRLKFLLQDSPKYGATESGDDFSEQLPRYIRITDLDKDGAIRNDNPKSLIWEKAVEYLLEVGDVLFARSGATAGKNFHYKGNFRVACFAGYLIRVRADKQQLLPEFLALFTKTSCYWQQIAGSQTQATIQNVNAEKYKELILAIPIIDEQKRIIRFLDRETTPIDALIEKTEKSVELLKERRSALITAAVTGQIDVRDAV